MKRTILILALMTVALCGYAVKRPPLALGLTYDYATEYHQHGFGLKLELPVGHRFRVEPEMIYFNENRQVTTLFLNLNVHYLLPLASRFNVYPFAGLSYSHWGYVGPNVNRWGMNLGGGFDYRLSRRFSALAELRFNLVSRETQLITSLGLKYHF